MRKNNNNFRVLGLSATPGTNEKSIQNVIQNLLISHLEVRTEGSIDIQKYIHGRNTEKVVLPLSTVENTLLKNLMNICASVVGRLQSAKAIYAQSHTKLSSYSLISMRDAFRKSEKNEGLARKVEGEFALAISLYRAADLLQTHGVSSCYTSLMNVTSFFLFFSFFFSFFLMGFSRSSLETGVLGPWPSKTF